MSVLGKCSISDLHHPFIILITKIHWPFQIPQLSISVDFKEGNNPSKCTMFVLLIFERLVNGSL